jgi:hypothetical protein
MNKTFTPFSNVATIPAYIALILALTACQTDPPVTTDVSGQTDTIEDTAADDTETDTPLLDVHDSIDDTGEADVPKDTLPTDTIADNQSSDTQVEDTETDANPEDVAEDIEEDVAPECTKDDDCDELASPCQTATCNTTTGSCVVTDSADGSACDDANPCSLDDTCLAGNCGGTSALKCDDGNDCTDDTCTPASGCVFSTNFQACDDGDPCTQNDGCVGGACQAGQGKCDDGNPCTVDSCDPDNGTCSNTADNGSPCDDGSECSGGDSCQGGECISGEQDGCDDGNQCTENTCEDDNCKTKVLNGFACEDGDACTAGDKCLGAACAPGIPNDCDDGNVCKVGTCDSEEGGCQYEILVEAPCDDDSVCSPSSLCDGNGDCTATKLIDCNDDNLCTNDLCSPILG